MATVPEYTGIVPARNQAQDVFNTNMAQYFSYIANLAPAINTTAQEINDTAATVAQTTAEEAAARTATEVEAALTVYVNDASGYATDAANSATLASNLADATAANTETYTSTTAGLAATVDGDYFRVIEAPEAERVSVYRNDGGAATLITTYYTKTGVDAKQAAAVRLNRSLQRLGDHGQTLHSDFNLNAYGLGSQLYGGVQDAMEAEELWDVVRPSPDYALSANGKYRLVPPNTISRAWNPETGQYEAQISGAVTNELLRSTDFSNAAWIKTNATAAPTAESIINGYPVSKVNALSGSASYIYQSVVLVQGVTYTLWSLVKKIPEGGPAAPTVRLRDFTEDGSAGFNIGESTLSAFSLSGYFSDSGLVDLNNGFVLIWARFTPTVDGSHNISPIHFNVGDASNEAFFAHAQLEQGTRPTSPIITTDAPKTRAADNISRTLGAEFNVSEGTIIVEFNDVALRSSATTAQVLGLFDAAANTPRLIVECLPRVQLRDAGDVNIPDSLSFGSAYSGGRGIVGFSWDAGGYRLAFNGQVNESNTPIEGIDLLSRTAPLFGYGNLVNRSDGRCSLLTLSTRALSTTQLQELTAL